MAGISSADKRSAREETLQSVLDALSGISGTDNPAALAALEGIRGLLEATLTVEGSVELGSTTVTGLQTAFTNSLATNHTDLQTIAGDLTDVHTRLLDMFEQGQLVGLEPADMTTLATAIATLWHYPTDYPDATAHTDAGVTNTALGTDTGTPPSSGTGVRGWLRGIYDLLNSGTLIQNLKQLNGTTVDTNSGNKSAGTQRIVLATDQPNLTTALNVADPHITDNTQTTKITNGTQSADTAAGDSGNNAVLTGGGIKTTPIASATVTVDCSTYRYVSFQLIGTGSVTPQQSNDNSTWVNCPYFGVPTAGAGLTVGVISNSAGNYQAVVGTRYFRLQYNSGAVTGSVVQSTTPFSSNAGVLSQQSGTWNVAQASGNPTTTGWAVGGPSVTLSNNASTSAVAGSAFNTAAMYSWWGMQIIIGGTGSLSALSVILEGSLDTGINWKTIATYSGTTTDYVAGTAAMPFNQVRARIATYTAASGTPTVSTRIGGTI